MKFYKKSFTLTKAYANTLNEKMEIFRETTQTNKLLLWVFITPYGLKPNQHSLNLVHNALTLDALFIA